MTDQSVATGTVSELFPRSFKEGLSVQGRFIDILQARGQKVGVAHLYADMVQHIDVWAEFDGRDYGIDIKGMKRIYRDLKYQNQYTLLELHAAHANNKGWLYGGRADLIAFEQETSFVLAWRARLIDIVEFRVTKERVPSSGEALYKVYSRRDNEEITWIETSLIRHPWVLFQEIPKE